MDSAFWQCFGSSWDLDNHGSPGLHPIMFLILGEPCGVEYWIGSAQSIFFNSCAISLIPHTPTLYILWICITLKYFNPLYIHFVYSFRKLSCFFCLWLSTFYISIYWRGFFRSILLFMFFSYKLVLLEKCPVPYDILSVICRWVIFPKY